MFCAWRYTWYDHHWQDKAMNYSKGKPNILFDGRTLLIYWSGRPRMPCMQLVNGFIINKHSYCNNIMHTVLMSSYLNRVYNAYIGRPIHWTVGEHWTDRKYLDRACMPWACRSASLQSVIYLQQGGCSWKSEWIGKQDLIAVSLSYSWSQASRHVYKCFSYVAELITSTFVLIMEFVLR